VFSITGILTSNPVLWGPKHTARFPVMHIVKRGRIPEPGGEHEHCLPDRSGDSGGNCLQNPGGFLHSQAATGGLLLCIETSVLLTIFVIFCLGSE
jgi:hypothetical protein